MEGARRIRRVIISSNIREDEEAKLLNVMGEPNFGV